MDRYNELHEHLKELCNSQWIALTTTVSGGIGAVKHRFVCMDRKMELTSIPDEEWAQVENAALKFWDEIAAESETKAKVVDIFKKYNADMQKLVVRIAIAKTGSGIVFRAWFRNIF